MKSKRVEEVLLRRYRKNAETIRALDAEQANLRKMLAAVGIVPDGDEAPDATVHQLRVVTQQDAAAIPQPERWNLKPMVRVAMTEYFKNGANKAQIIDFFGKEWGQKIKPTSLGVILSNMGTAGELVRKNQLWYWVKKEGPDE
jgi:hypothetical protein